MKRHIFTFLLALFALPVVVLSAEASSIRLMGDVDNNGAVNYADAMGALRASVELESLDSEAWECADVDNNGKVDYADAMLILQRSVQLVEAFPADTCAVTYQANGENVSGLPAALEVKRGDILEMPEPPTKEDYTFEGWYRDADCTQAFGFQEPVMDDITLYALWLKYEEPIPEEPLPDVTVPEQPEPKVIDLTAKLDALMHKNAATMRSVLARRGWYLAAFYFYNMVKDGGDWDIKLQDEWKFEEGVVYMYQGKVMRWDDPGNIHFGYVGAVVFSEEAVCLGAGLNQITKFGFSFGDFSSYYDDPRDQEMMRWGHRLYKSGY